MYIIEITPRQADRARAGRKKDGSITFRNTDNYHLYKKTLRVLLKGRNMTIDGRKVRGVKITPADYYGYSITFYKPYPKSTPKYKRIEGAMRRVKPDLDNEAKAFQDALEQAKVIRNDSQLCYAIIKQKYTIQEHGRIEFKLFKHEES